MRRIVEHLGSAHDEAELAALMHLGHQRLLAGQQVLDQGSALDGGDQAAGHEPGDGGAVRRPAIISRRSGWLIETIKTVYARLGLGEAVRDDRAFEQMVVARLIEPTSRADTPRVLSEIGWPAPAHRNTLQACLARGLRDDELICIVLGDYRRGEESGSIVGAASTTVIGAAGQTTTRIPGLPSIIMADGPAGLRLAPTYGVDAEGPFSLGDSSLPATFLELMDDAGREALGIADEPEPREPTEIREQYTTAIPIGTALAQSWNPALAERLGDVVGAEMERFGIHLWLAPAFNLHRSVLCGRNFEYLSEDPLLAGRLAAAITHGVQSHPGRGVTIKHLACNNQETNRLNSNSRVSPRALRDLYLRAFEICVRQARPAAVMTSYNLINGVHTSESAQLLEVILRREWGFDGLVMTDWVVDGMTRSDMKHPRATAAATIKAGNELFMPGGETDREDLLAALERGSAGRGPGGRIAPEDGGVSLTRDELEKQAARVIHAVWRLAGSGRRLLAEAEAGRRSGEERGWITAADVRAHFARRTGDGA